MEIRERSLLIVVWVVEEEEEEEVEDDRWFGERELSSILRSSFSWIWIWNCTVSGSGSIRMLFEVARVRPL